MTLIAVCSCGGTDTRHEPLAIADPFIMYYDGVYYAYGTGGDGPGFDVYLSDDLKTWRRHPQKALSPENSYGKSGFWAPEVYLNHADGRFYLFYTSEEHICVATGDSPLGPFSQESRSPMIEGKAIDPSLFIDTDGTPYLYFVRFTDGNVIWSAELDRDDWTSLNEDTMKECIVAGLPWETVMGKVAEGPSVLKKEGIYYMIYSANHFMSPDYAVGYATSSSPADGWVKNSSPIMRRPGNLVGTGHGAVFTDRDGKERYVFHSHRDSSAVHPRILHIADVRVEDGRVKIDAESIITPGVVTEPAGNVSPVRGK